MDQWQEQGRGALLLDDAVLTLAGQDRHRGLSLHHQ